MTQNSRVFLCGFFPMGKKVKTSDHPKFCGGEVSTLRKINLSYCSRHSSLVGYGFVLGGYLKLVAIFGGADMDSIFREVLFG